jgi:hypothetical protein
MIPCSLVVVLACGACCVFFLLGRLAGRNALLYELESDVYQRREMIEKLAKLEGLRLVGHE